MEVDSDDGDDEPKLKIVDEEEQPRPAAVLSPRPPPAAAAVPQGVRLLRKSFSFEGVKNEQAVRSSSDDSEAIASLLLLGQGPVLSPPSRELEVMRRGQKLLQRNPHVSDIEGVDTIVAEKSIGEFIHGSPVPSKRQRWWGRRLPDGLR